MHRNLVDFFSVSSFQFNCNFRSHFLFQTALSRFALKQSPSVKDGSMSCPVLHIAVVVSFGTII